MDEHDPSVQGLLNALRENPLTKDMVESKYRMKQTELESMGKNTGLTLDGSMTLIKTDVLEGLTAMTVDVKGLEDSRYGVNNKGLGKKVVVSGELVLGTDVAEIIMETDEHGNFRFNVPPYYGNAILFLSANDTGISDAKTKKLQDRGRTDESMWTKYYVKRNLFYPIFAKRYSYYQCHYPKTKENTDVPEVMEDTGESISSMDKSLDEVIVKKRKRRGRHAIDYSKPAYVYDTYELYNLVTDYGLSFGKLNFRRFPMQIGMLLLGNYGTERSLNVDGRMNNDLFYRSYGLERSNMVNGIQRRSDHELYNDLVLRRQKEVRIFTDFELRNEDRDVEMNYMTADITVNFVTFPDGGKQYTFRDRRIVLHGLTEPSEFYCPDYSRKPLPEMKDYRRTLYWNPNAKLDSNGNFKAEFYNGSREVRMKVSAEGLTTEGKTIINQ